jgi:hypothetical protein
MRRSSTRRTGVLPATATGSTGSVNKAAVRELEKIDAFFSQYADKFDETSIGPDGIEALCQDLGVSPTDIRVLLLAWYADFDMSWQIFVIIMVLRKWLQGFSMQS